MIYISRCKIKAGTFFKENPPEIRQHSCLVTLAYLQPFFYLQLNSRQLATHIHLLTSYADNCAELHLVFFIQISKLRSIETRE
jgi:hypothetical protein